MVLYFSVHKMNDVRNISKYYYRMSHSRKHLQEQIEWESHKALNSLL